MSIKNLLGGKTLQVIEADHLTAGEPIVWSMRNPLHLTISWTFTACYTDNFFFYFIIKCNAKFILRYVSEELDSSIFKVEL
jgi:hypothetical protein